jgi:ectoine hydroxylase-related dioxygenase (phytanoyl-CoA dioxygenase family)
MSATHPLQKHLDDIARDGFTVVENVLPPDDIPELRAKLQCCVDEDLRAWEGREYPDRWMVHNLMVRDHAFARVLENPALHAYLSAILGDTCILYAYTSSSMPPRGTNYSNRVHVDCPRFIPGYVTNLGVTIALDDFTEENGATYQLPGSHLSPEVPSEEHFFRHARRLFPRTGDAIVFNARTWHSGGQNRTDVARHALTMNVCRSYMRQRFDYPRLVPPEVVARLGDVGRRFLGFNVRVPVSLEEYYLPPDQRLYKAGQG